MTSLSGAVAPMAKAPSAPRGSRLTRAHLLLTAFLVVAIIVVGGATRLTESGLSITEWNVVMGILPPLTEAHWLAEFEKYRAIPQYALVNRGMSLADFQWIYWWEWGHRLLGRVIGLVFVLGALGLFLARALDRSLALKMLGIALLIGLQGAIGWWMVASGLTERVTVAPYRLGAHLTLACLILAALLWLARDLAPARAAPPTVPDRVRGTALILLLAVFAQIFLGALVAGTRSGYAYQTWPLMDGALWPGGMLAMAPWWINFFENTGTTQFVHRLMAYAILALAAWHFFDVRRSVSDLGARRRAGLLVAALLVQAGIGVATLWSGMALPIALAHQAWIAAVIAAALSHRHALIRG